MIHCCAVFQVLFFFLMGAGSLSAKDFYALSLGDLEFIDKSPDLVAQRNLFAMDNFMVGVRSEKTAYLGDAGNADRRSWIAIDELRVAVTLDDEEVFEGVLDLPGSMSGGEVQSFAFKIDPKKTKKCDEKTFEKIRQHHYARLSRNHLPGTFLFQELAGADLREEDARERPEIADESFAFFSGGQAIAENLALDRDLVVADEKKGELVPLAGIDGITIKAIDWAPLLPKEKVAVDPLSLLIPEDQHAVFFPSVDSLFKLLNLLENEGMPLMQGVSVRNPFRGLPQQYRAQMGLDLPDFFAKLLPVRNVALTGSDPFFPTGSEVAVLFQTDSPQALIDKLSLAMKLKAQAAGAKEASGEVDGLKYQAWTNESRSFSCFLAQVGEQVAVANTLGQLQRLQAVQKGEASLGGSEEYQYFRHRYPLGEEESAFLFVSDQTLRRWSGPRLRIAASRRVRALAELQKLVALRVVAKDEVPKSDFLGKVSQQDGFWSSENYGRVGFLTPVSELDLEQLTLAEKEAYERWRQGYEFGWRRVFDPIALRFFAEGEEKSLDLSILPLRVDSEYQDLISLVGKSALSARARSRSDEALFLASMAIDHNSPEFEELSVGLSEMLPSLKINPLSWLGSSLSLELYDGFFWKAAAQVQMNEEALLSLPAVLRAECQSPMKMALFLAAVKTMSVSSAPDLLTWEKREHEGRSYIVIHVSEEEMGMDQEIEICYAALPTALLVSLDEDLLKKSITREFAGVKEKEKKGEVPEAKHLFAKMDSGVFSTFYTLFKDEPFSKSRQRKSWQALPILNEWHQRFPEEDPVAVQKRIFGNDLQCPGGKGYRWNAEAHTMESVAFGYPAMPKNEGEDVALMKSGMVLQSGINFSDDGLRARVSLRKAKEKPVAKKEAKKDEGIDEDFGTAADYLPAKAGKSYRYSLSEGRSYRDNLLEIKTKEDGSKLFIYDSILQEEKNEEEKKSRKIYRLNGDFALLSQNYPDGSEFIFDPAMVEIPARLRAGETTRRELKYVRTEKGVSPQISIGEVEFKVIRLEKIEVPAGVFADCVKIEINKRNAIEGLGIMNRASTCWFAKGIGMVQQEVNQGGEIMKIQLLEIKGE